MIRTRSPYYKTVSFVSPETGYTCTKYYLKIRIWRGTQANKPVDPDYIIERYNYLNSTDSEEVEIASIADSFIENKLTPLGDGGYYQLTDNQVWLEAVVEYVTGRAEDVGLDQDSTTKICLRGYGSGIDGKNVLVPSNRILLNGTIHRVSKNSTFVIPAICIWDSIPVSIVSTPVGYYNKTYTLSQSYDSTKGIQLASIDTSLAGDDTRIYATVNGVNHILLLDEDKTYINTDVFFINQYGAQQSISMNRERVESTTTKRSEYERHGMQPKDGYHQFKTFLANGRGNITLNSSNMPESQNDAFKELLLSDSIWLVYDGVVYPVNIKTSNIVYKTRTNDQLISYVIDFSYSYNEVNNI